MSIPFVPRLIALAVLLLFVACSPAPFATPPSSTNRASSPSTSTRPALTPPVATPLVTAVPEPSIEPYPGAAWTLGGREVPTNAISLQEGPEHCGWDDISLLTIGRPLGQKFTTSDEARQYVRDPNGEFADKTVGKFLPSVTMPPDAFFTGYQYGSDELWATEASGDQIYMVRGGVVEQWPRARELFGCM